MHSCSTGVRGENKDLKNWYNMGPSKQRINFWEGVQILEKKQQKNPTYLIEFIFWADWLDLCVSRSENDHNHLLPFRHGWGHNFCDHGPVNRTVTHNEPKHGTTYVLWQLRHAHWSEAALWPNRSKKKRKKRQMYFVQNQINAEKKAKKVNEDCLTERWHLLSAKDSSLFVYHVTFCDSPLAPAIKYKSILSAIEALHVGIRKKNFEQITCISDNNFVPITPPNNTDWAKNLLNLCPKLCLSASEPQTWTFPATDVNLQAPCR